jgi:hypothetical protein
LRKDLPKAWDEVIHSAITLEPRERPPSAQEMARRMMVATPRGEEIARATASLLFTALSESTSQPPHSVDYDDPSGEEIAGAHLSRTLSVPLEGFGAAADFERRRGTSSASVSAFRRVTSMPPLMTASTMGLGQSREEQREASERRLNLFALGSVAMVFVLAVALVRGSASGGDARDLDSARVEENGRDPASQLGIVADGASADSDGSTAHGPIILPLTATPFGPEPPPEAEGRSPSEDVAHSHSAQRKTRQKVRPDTAQSPHAVPIFDDPTRPAPDNPDVLFRDRN